MSKFKEGDRVRLIQPGFAETGLVGTVIFEGDASVQVDFTTYGSSQLLDEWLVPDDGKPEWSTNAPITAEERALNRAEVDGFLRVMRRGTKAESFWWNRCEFLDQPWIVLDGKPGGNAYLKVDVSPKRSVRRLTDAAMKKIANLAITVYTEAYGGDRWHGGKYYAGTEIFTFHKLPFEQAEHLATTLHLLLKSSDMYEANPLPANVVPFRKGA